MNELKKVDKNSPQVLENLPIIPFDLTGRGNVIANSENVTINQSVNIYYSPQERSIETTKKESNQSIIAKFLSVTAILSLLLMILLKISLVWLVTISAGFQYIPVRQYSDWQSCNRNKRQNQICLEEL